jgi:hypothetical protein
MATKRRVAIVAGDRSLFQTTSTLAESEENSED